ncbi:MAG: PilZ domain-containing protein [Kofleriaceae bacterium]
MLDRRQHTRHPVALPVSVSTAQRRERVGVTRDLSVTGVLFHSASAFTPGEAVQIRIALAREAERVAHGVVVRSFEDPSPEHVLRKVTAVRFEHEVAEVDLLLS